MRLLWDKHENMTKELLITYNLSETSEKWKTTSCDLINNFRTFIVSPFTKRLAEKDVDFNIKVSMIIMHYSVANKGMKMHSIN